MFQRALSYFTPSNYFRANIQTNFQNHTYRFFSTLPKNNPIPECKKYYDIITKYEGDNPHLWERVRNQVNLIEKNTLDGHSTTIEDLRKFNPGYELVREYDGEPNKLREMEPLLNFFNRYILLAAKKNIGLSRDTQLTP